jgi:D-methionine transport system permease protein
MFDLLSRLSQYNNLMWSGSLETLYMVAMSLFFAIVLGIPLGVLTTITRPGHILPNKYLNFVLDGTINIGRSIPFIILMVAVIPFTRMVVGTSIGTNAAVVPLSLAAIPFMGRVTDNAILEVDNGVIESAQSMGASPSQIVFKVLLPESLPAIILGLTLTAISLVSYSAMAGAIGGGGLGDIAIRYGYQRFQLLIMLETIVILVVMVQVIQRIGNLIADSFDHR